MASKLEETLVHRQVVRHDCEVKLRDTLQRLVDLNLASSRRLLTLQFTQWLDANERCNEAARELSESIEPEIAAPVVEFRGRAVAV
jgi:hypothetical protein